MKKSYLLIISSSILIFLLLGCRQNTQNYLHDIPIHTINYLNIKKDKISHLPDSILGEKKYILLNGERNELQFGQISKIQIMNNRIYILDRHFKKLITYNSDGHVIGKIGEFGQGPNEYLMISDFDIDNKGNIYFIDGRLDKLNIYDPNLQFIKSYKLPFEADIIKVLDNGNYMFGLSSWNKGEGENYKIIVTDSLLKIQKSYLHYDKYVDPNYWISFYAFSKSNKYIVYNQPIDNNLYLFSFEGELKKIINFNFGKQNVPDEKKIDIERNLNEYDNYCLLKNVSVVTNNIIIGTIWDRRQTKIYIYDKINSKIYMSDPFFDYETTQFTGYSSNYFISYLDPNDTNDQDIPLYVKKHLEEENFALCIQKLNNNYQ